MIIDVFLAVMFVLYKLNVTVVVIFTMWQRDNATENRQPVV